MNISEKMETEIENYLRDLGLTWVTIAAAMSDENRVKACQLVINNPQITKQEFLKEMQIKEYKY